MIAVAPGSFQSSSAARATGTRTACAPGSRTRTATAPTPSRPPRSRPAPTRRRSRSMRAGTRTTAQGGVTERREHPVHRPGRQHAGHLHLRPDLACPFDRRRGARRRTRLARRRSRTSTWRARTASAPRATRLEGLVHGRERRALRRLLPDGRQHERRDAAVHRHRRLDVHRPPDARHDLHGRGRRRLRRHGVHGDRDGEERQVHDRDDVHHRPEPEAS